MRDLHKRKKIRINDKPTVLENNRHFVIFEFKYHAYLLRVYGSYRQVKI